MKPIKLIAFLILILPLCLYSQKYKKLEDYKKNNIKIGLVIAVPNKLLVTNNATQTNSIKSGLKLGISLEYVFYDYLSLIYSSYINYVKANININKHNLNINEIGYSSFFGLKLTTKQFNYNKYFLKLGLDLSVYDANVVHDSQRDYQVKSSSPTWLNAIPPFIILQTDNIVPNILIGIGTEYDFMNNIEAHLGLDFSYSLGNDYLISVDNKINSENKFKSLSIIMYLKINYKFMLNDIKNLF